MPSRRRLLIWAAGLVVYTVLLVVTGTLLWTFLVFPPWSDEGVFDWLHRGVDQLGDFRWWAYTLPVSAVISLTQYLFLLPVVRLRPPDGTRSRSLTLSLGVGGLLAAIITAAIGLAVVELIGSLMHGNFHDEPWGQDLFGEVWIWPALGMTLLGSWVLWTMVLLIFARRLWADTVLGRLVVLLLGGTIVELLVVLPIDAVGAETFGLLLRRRNLLVVVRGCSGLTVAHRPRYRVRGHHPSSRHGPQDQLQQLRPLERTVARSHVPGMWLRVAGVNVASPQERWPGLLLPGSPACRGNAGSS
jgi:hypothetical protein